VPLAKPLILEPLGLVTEPNKLGQYPDGAMCVDIGIVHSGAGSHETAPLFVETWAITAPSAVLKAEAIPVPTGYTLLLVKVAAGWRYAWVNTLNVASAFAAAVHAYAPSGADFEIDGRVNWIITRDRVFVTTTTGPMVFDYLAPTTDAERAPRLAGMFSPAISAAPVTGTDASAIKQDMQAHLVAVVTRHFPDCYEVTGAPSAAVQVYAEGSAVNIALTVIQRTNHMHYIPGDTIEVYRTYQSTRPIPGALPEDYVQGTSTDANYFMSSTFEIPDPTAASHTWEEATGDQSLGDALYTNNPIAGTSAQKRPPPIARVIEEYKGYTFYFDITEPAVRVARIAAGMGELSDAWSDTWGVGTHTGAIVDNVSISGSTVAVPDANALAAMIVCNVDDLARVNPDTPGKRTTPATGVAFRHDFAGAGDFTLLADHGANYIPTLPELGVDAAEEVSRPRRKNGFTWTENGQPEACVAAGLTKNGDVYAACATSQAMIICTSIGLFRLSGTGGSVSAGFDWGLDHIDTQVLIRGPKAICRLGDLVFIASNNGAIVVDASGQVREISTSALGKIGVGRYSITDKTRLVADEETGDVYFCFDGTRYPYVYSSRWNKWSRVCVADSEVISASGSLQRGLAFVEIEADEVVLRQKSASIYQQSIARMQPTYAGDVSSLKRFSEVEFYFHGRAEGAPVTFICNEIEGIERNLEMYDGDNTPSFIQAGIDADVQSDAEEFSLASTWMEVPMDAPAVANSLSLGYTTPEGATKYTFYGCAVTLNQYRTIRRGKGED
jgi:hypothetical protein